jgi:hypothetical protein
MTQPESHTPLYDACQEILRLEAVQKELVEALEEMVSQFDQFGLIDCEEQAIKEARAALAKAKGETK